MRHWLGRCSDADPRNRRRRPAKNQGCVPEEQRSFSSRTAGMQSKPIWPGATSTGGKRKASDTVFKIITVTVKRFSFYDVILVGGWGCIKVESESPCSSHSAAMFTNILAILTGSLSGGGWGRVTDHTTGLHSRANHCVLLA